MKKLTILSAIAMSGLIYSTANAQMSIRVGLHFGTPVAVRTAPVYNEPASVNYDADDYYYLPDVGAYYSVNEECYYYFDGDSWISAAYLPGEYRDYDWRTARRFEVRAPRPYMHDEIYRSKYNGHEVSAWARADHQERYNAPVQRGYDQHFDNRGQSSYHQSAPQNNGPRFENRGQGSYNQPAPQNNGQRFENRGQGGYSQPAPQNNGQRFENRGQGGYNQPATQNNGQRFNNNGQGSTSQSAQPSRGQGGYTQPSGQNGHDRGNNGGGQHYVNNSPQGGLSDRRMTRF